MIEHLDRGPLSRDEMAALVARDIPAGSFVNLGIGQPTLVADHLAPASGVVLHTENGMTLTLNSNNASPIAPPIK